jgi:hypothetical protein
MRRFHLRFCLPLLLLAAFTTSASAAVKIRIAVRPDTIPQCHPGRFFIALANTGDHPIVARVSLALVRGDSVVLGPFGGRVRLAAGERRHREFDFRIPPMFPPGPYAWVARAIASDSTSDRAAAPFLVVRGECPPPPTEPAQLQELQNSMIEGIGLQPEDSTPTIHRSWGSLKRHYR